MKTLRVVVTPDRVSNETEIRFWTVEVQEQNKEPSPFAAIDKWTAATWRTVQRWPRLTLGEALSIYVPLAESWIENGGAEPRRDFDAIKVPRIHP